MRGRRHPVEVRAYRDGPIIVRGAFELRDRAGTPIPVRRRTVALCRCGSSRLGVFCDGTHKVVGFTAPADPPWPGDADAAPGGGSRPVA